MKIIVDRFKKKFIVREEKDGSGLLSFKGTLLRINNTSMEILKAVQNRETPLEIAFSMEKQYKVERKFIEEDIDYFMNQLAQIGLIDKKEYMEYMNHESI